MDRLAKLKLTCSNVRIRAKLDLLGEDHGKEIIDLQQMSKEEELVAEQEKRVVTLTVKCAVYKGMHAALIVFRILQRPKKIFNRLSWLCTLALPLHLTILMEGVSENT